MTWNRKNRGEKWNYMKISWHNLKKRLELRQTKDVHNIKFKQNKKERVIKERRDLYYGTDETRTGNRFSR